MAQLLLGLALSALIGGLGYRGGSLSKSGVLGAILTGTLIFGLGGLVWGGLLVAFFVSSSALSHWQATHKAPVADLFSKGGQRDLGQVLANGGVGAALAVGHWLLPHPLWLAAFVGTMAAVNADTWATEIGVLSPTQPRLITTFRLVPTGTSGGVTWLGSLAALAGGLFIGLCAILLTSLSALLPSLLPSLPPLPFLPSLSSSTFLTIGGLAGFLSALFDSLLGATVQRVYVCSVCGQATERVSHCGQPTRPARGLPWLNNDGVNGLAALVGAVLGVVVGVW